MKNKWKYKYTTYVNNLSPQVQLSVCRAQVHEVWVHEVQQVSDCLQDLGLLEDQEDLEDQVDLGPADSKMASEEMGLMTK